MSYHYYIIHKPYQVLSQFSEQENKQCLAHYFKVEKNVYPVGRLDYDSEGLLILSNDKSLNNLLLNPLHQHSKTYWVQVEGSITTQALQQLQKGVTINVNGKLYNTKPCLASLLGNDIVSTISERNTPIRYRENIATTWISITITEGKNRQVRKMTAAVGFPTLRLIRYSIEDISLGNLAAGSIIKLSKNAMYKKLKIAT